MTTCNVHILDAGRPYRTITWTVGEHVGEEDYRRFKDANGDLYVLVYYEDDKAQMRIVLREAWYRAKTAIDRNKAGK
jgi:hypothetical protein